MKKLNEHCDVANEESNKLSEIILESRKGLELRNNKIIEKRLLYEYQLKQIQEIYAGLKAEENTRKDLHNQNLDLMGNIRVMCRVRPYTDKEKEIEQVSLECFDDKHTIQVSTKRLRLWQMQIEKSTYEFDHVFNTSADQKEVYLELSPLVQSAIDGYNVCIFAYGQTGSGKTYTMEGNVNSPEKKGVIPRSIDEIFDKIEETNKLGWNFEVYVQYIEIYNETIQDLLIDEDKDRKKSCKDRKKSFKEDRKKSFKESKDLCKIVYNEDTRMTIIENAERLKISKKKDMEILIDKASNHRSKSSTNSNSVSSRSHGVFILHLEGENPLEKMSSRGSLSLVDLAGSENIDKSGSVGDQMTEAQSINKSLFYLRYVIQQIKDKSNHVNYRDSVLTSLLKYSLGGTAKVCMLVNVSPSTDSTNETKKSLSFGQDARKAHVGTAMRNGCA
ncbi:kinesin-domain-containing protein [Rhizophagus irregularis]|uniref:Kinesin-like protein n=1 Tax=Rhizophagus irregularis TaxID=588596 RepID=A0A2N1N4N6_9GLOM|nr:kinesin-domain-containing protein [Rhizophagus irregularis]